MLGAWITFPKGFSQRRLVCVYEPAGYVYFWNKIRPELAEHEIPYASQVTELFADAAPDTCPPTFGAALKVGFGEQFVEQRRATLQKAADDKAARELASQQWAQRLQRESVEWAAGAQVLSKDRLADAVSRLSAALTRLEASVSNFDEQDFAIFIDREITAPLVEVARSGVAEAKAIPPGEVGRKAFESWDRGTARVVISASMRMQRIHRPTWGNSGKPFHVWHFYRKLYEQQLTSRAPFEPSLYAQMLRALEARRIEDAKVRPPQPPEFVATYTMTIRGKYAGVYRSINNNAVNFARLAHDRAEAQKSLRKLHAWITNSRKAFWSCYERRCPEIADLWADYSQALTQKDNYYAFRYLMDGAFESAGGSVRFMDILAGTDLVVDGGQIDGCDQEWDNFLNPIGAEIQKRGSLAGFSGAVMLLERMSTDEFLRVHQCRDRMEFIRRPR